MNKIIKFLIGLYLISAVGAWALLSKNTDTNKNLEQNLTATEMLLASAQEKNTTLDAKITSARASAELLSLSLCPTLETSKDALCVKNSTEWFSQIIQKAKTTTDAETKTKIEKLIVTLGDKQKPTAKNFYEMLKPVELSSLKALSENLK